MGTELEPLVEQPAHAVPIGPEHVLRVVEQDEPVVLAQGLD